MSSRRVELRGELHSSIPVVVEILTKALVSETAIKLQVSVFVVNISAFGENRFNLCYIFGLGLYSISLSFTVPLLVIECKMPILFFEQGCTGQHEQSCVGQHEQG